MFRSFLRRDRGNTSLLVAICLLPVVGLLGGSVDIIRANTASNELEAAIAAGALAAANLNQQGDAEAVVRDYVLSNLTGTAMQISRDQIVVNAESSLNSRRVEVTASATLPTVFLTLFSRDQFNLSARTVATQAIQEVEISLVLDFSTSMLTADQSGGKTRLQTLREAVTGDGAFIDDLLVEDTVDHTSFNVIPFAGNVNVGQSLFDRYAAPAVQGQTRTERQVVEQCFWFFFWYICQDVEVDVEVEVVPGNLNPSSTAYGIGSDVETAGFRFSEGDNCLEYENSHFDDDSEFPLETLGQNPHYWSGQYFRSACPDSTAEILLNNNNKTEIKNHINNANAADWTAAQTGAMIGYKMLSPNFRNLVGGDFPERPLDFNAVDSIKVMVLMTDGQLTEQYRPVDYTRYSLHTSPNYAFVSKDNANGQNGNTPFNGGGNWGNYQRVLTVGSPDDAITSNNATQRLRRVCDHAKSNGVVIFTIGFEISAGSDQEKNLQYCASDPSKYQLVSDLDLVDAFEEIASSITNLRIVE